MSIERQDHIISLLYKIIDRLDIIEQRLCLYEQESVTHVDDFIGQTDPIVYDSIYDCDPVVCDPVVYDPVVYNPVYDCDPVVYNPLCDSIVCDPLFYPPIYDYFFNNCYPVEWYINKPLIEPIYEYESATSDCYELIIFDN